MFNTIFPVCSQCDRVGAFPWENNFGTPARFAKANLHLKFAITFLGLRRVTFIHLRPSGRLYLPSSKNAFSNYPTPGKRPRNIERVDEKWQHGVGQVMLITGSNYKRPGFPMGKPLSNTLDIHGYDVPNSATN